MIKNGPFYIARERGYNRDVGLDVELSTLLNLNQQFAALAYYRQNKRYIDARIVLNEASAVDWAACTSTVTSPCASPARCRPRRGYRARFRLRQP